MLRLLIFLCCGMWLTLMPARGQEPAPGSTSPAAAQPLPGVKIAETVSATTGVAISPLLGVSTLGAWRYWHTPAPARLQLPWHGRPWFWGPALVLVLLLAAKEPLLYFLPGAKKPLDLLEGIENKASALLAAPVVIQMAIDAVRPALPAEVPVALVAAGFGTSWLALVAAVLGLLAVFACVWLVAHTVNMLILLSPSATLDILLRAFRSSVLAVLTLGSLLSPWLGLLLAAAIIYVAVRCFGWAWRLNAMASTVALDWLGRRKRGGPGADGQVRAFLARARGGLPVRTRGTFGPGLTGELEFRGHPLPWLPERVLPVPAADARLVRSFPGPALIVTGEAGLASRWLSLPPRYHGAEESLGQAFGLAFDTENPLGRNLRAAIAWLRDTIVSNARLVPPAAPES